VLRIHQNEATPAPQHMLKIIGVFEITMQYSIISYLLIPGINCNNSVAKYPTRFVGRKLQYRLQVN
jgi:hypothetical protein